MDIERQNILVTGGASGLGLATAEKAWKSGARVWILDLASSKGREIAEARKGDFRFIACDVTHPDTIAAAISEVESAGELRGVVHCAGIGANVRLVNRDGTPGSLEDFTRVVNVNLFGSFNVLRLTAASMARNEPVDGERGVITMTASIAAWEGQIGQIPYAASKAGIVGMTIVAARDLARRGIRVNSIAPGIFATPILDRLPDEVKQSLGASIPFPPRLGAPEEFADLALHIFSNQMFNGETVRLDGAIRMQPK